MISFRHITLFIFACLCSIFVQAQIRKDLDEKRQQLKEEIALIQESLDNTAQDKRYTMSQLKTLQRQIDKQEELIATISEELGLIVSSMERGEEIIVSLEQDIERIKEDYQQMLRHAHRYKSRTNRAMFVFAADNFNQAWQRWQYLKRYDQSRRKQADLIIKTQNRLNRKIEEFAKRKKEKENLLTVEKEEKNDLNTKLADKKSILSRLKSKESQLRADIVSKKKASTLLNKQIEGLIDEFMPVSQPEKEPTVSSYPTTPADTQLAENFRKSKGKLPWPVESGFISSEYGWQNHPVFTQLETFNNGIDIRVPYNASVKSVFKGEVINVFFVPGHQNAIMLKHGDYFTVYTNIREVYVSKGDQVITGQTLGLAGQDMSSNDAEIHFEVWRKKDRQDPMAWIKRR